MITSEMQVFYFFVMLNRTAVKNIPLYQCDFRYLEQKHINKFDPVICLTTALPHLHILDLFHFYGDYCMNEYNEKNRRLIVAAINEL